MLLYKICSYQVFPKLLHIYNIYKSPDRLLSAHWEERSLQVVSATKHVVLCSQNPMQVSLWETILSMQLVKYSIVKQATI